MRRQGLFSAAAFAGMLLGLLGAQALPTRPQVPEEPVWKKFARPAPQAGSQQHFETHAFLPDEARRGSYPTVAARWSEPVPLAEPQWAGAEPLPPEPEPLVDMSSRAGLELVSTPAPGTQVLVPVETAPAQIAAEADEAINAFGG